MENVDYFAAFKSYPKLIKISTKLQLQDLDETSVSKSQPNQTKYTVRGSSNEKKNVKKNRSSWLNCVLRDDE